MSVVGAARQPARRRPAEADHRPCLGRPSQAFLVCAAIGLLALIIALAAIRVTRGDLSGVDPVAAPADQARSAREE